MKKIALTMLLLTTPAFAHAHLEKSTPTANAGVKAPGQIVLNFSEKLEPAFSGATLSDAEGRTVRAAAAVGGATVTLIPAPLKPGTYRVQWHSVGQDTHRMSGGFSFTVIP